MNFSQCNAIEPIVKLQFNLELLLSELWRKIDLCNDNTSTFVFDYGFHQHLLKGALRKIGFLLLVMDVAYWIKQTAVNIVIKALLVYPTSCPTANSTFICFTLILVSSSSCDLFYWILMDIIELPHVCCPVWPLKKGTLLLLLLHKKKVFLHVFLCFFVSWKYDSAVDQNTIISW